MCCDAYTKNYTCICSVRKYTFIRATRIGVHLRMQNLFLQKLSFGEIVNILSFVDRNVGLSGYEYQ